jgi:hypothetical protein
MPSTQPSELPALSEAQKRYLADLTVEGRRAIARASADAYEFHQLYPERDAVTVRLEWESGVYLTQLQRTLLAIETALGLPPQNLPAELFGPRMVNVQAFRAGPGAGESF